VNPTNGIPVIPPDSLPQNWSHYATAFNALLLGGGFMFRHVIGWWLSAGGWAGIKDKFLHGNNPTQPQQQLPKP
jgi:hypothetical protein